MVARARAAARRCRARVMSLDNGLRATRRSAAEADYIALHREMGGATFSLLSSGVGSRAMCARRPSHSTMTPASSTKRSTGSPTAPHGTGVALTLPGCARSAGTSNIQGCMLSTEKAKIFMASLVEAIDTMVRNGGVRMWNGTHGGGRRHQSILCADDFLGCVTSSHQREPAGRGEGVSVAPGGQCRAGYRRSSSHDRRAPRAPRQAQAPTAGGCRG
jgi:hypothetical protein